MGKKFKGKGKKPNKSAEDDEDDVVSDEGDIDSDDDRIDRDSDEEAELGSTAPASKGKFGPDREPIYDADAMHEKLEDIGWADHVDWEETLALTHDDPTQVEDVDDDMARELAFYNQALASVQEAIRKFNAGNIPWYRPPDYYAEMVKSDQHMNKVKEQLMYEQRSIEQAEERRKQRETKQYAKQMQVEKQKERTATKKKQIEAVQTLRKQREKSGFAGDFDLDRELSALEQKQQRPPARYQDRNYPKAGPKSKHRMIKDAKYGAGGKKSLKKKNDAVSAANTDSFRPMKKGLPGKGGPGGVKKQPMKRPGKAARQSKNKGRK